jgi:hypothetical protein
MSNLSGSLADCVNLSVSPAGQPDCSGYIALHKKVKAHFALQYGTTMGPLTVSQSAFLMLVGCRPGGRPSAVWL